MPRIEIESDLEELPRLAEFIGTFADAHALAPQVTMQLNLALEELVTNVIQHGYVGESGSIHLELEREGDTIRAELKDRARAFDPFTAAEPELDASLEDRKIGGLGVHLVREFADSFAYRREGDENQVRISMRV